MEEILSIGAIIPARMSSRRLPGKVLMKLGDKPMLEWVVGAVLRSKVERVVVLVTPDPQDGAILDVCNKLGVDFFVGSANRDVLGDFYAVATTFGFDPVVRVTADCPLLSPLVINSVLNEYSMGCDYCSNIVTRTYPRGLDVEVLSYNALEKIQRNVVHDPNEPDYRKHVTLYVRANPGMFVIHSVALNLSKFRLTVDTQDDYDKLTAMFTLMSDEPSWVQAAELANKFPEFALLEMPGMQTPALGKVW